MATTALRWWLLGLLFFGRLGLGFQFQTLGSVADDIGAEMDLSYTEIGTLVGLFLLPGIGLALPGGFANRLLSDRYLVGLGLAALGLGGVIAALAEGFGALAIGRIICGVGFVISTIYFVKMVADWFSDRELATAMAVLMMSWPFGIALGQVSHEWIAAIWSWRLAFVVSATYCFIAAVLIAAMYRGPVNEKPLVVQSALSRPEFTLTIIASVVWAFFNAGYIIYISFAPLALTANGFSSMSSALMISVASWVMIFSGAACAYVADRTGRSDVVLYICLTGGALSLALLPVADSPWLLILIFGLIGGAPAGVIMALVGEAMAPERRAFGIGVFFTSYFVVITPLPTLAGWLYDYAQTPAGPMLFAAALFVAAGIANAIFRIAQRHIARDTIRTEAAARHQRT
ncbi:MAG: MFS transporter [Pseudomonadota bacterium]